MRRVYFNPVSAGEGQRRGYIYLPLDTYIMGELDCPNLDGIALEEFILHRIKKFYPGDPNDCLIHTSREGSRARVLIAKKSTLATYRGNGRANFICAVSGLVEPKDDFTRIVAMPGCIEVVRRIGGIWSIVAQYSGVDLPLEPDWHIPSMTTQLVVYGDIALPPFLASLALDSLDMELAARSFKGCAFPFHVTNGLRHIVPILAFSLALAMANLGAILLRDSALTASVQYRLARAEASALFLKVQDLQRELSLKMEPIDAVMQNKPSSLLQAVEKTGLVITITSYAYDDGHYRLRGRTADAIELGRLLDAEGNFSDLELSDVQTDPLGGQAFTLSGVAHDR